MQKVCHITSAHPRYDQRILYRECVSLKDAGYDVTLLVNDELENESFKGVHIKSTGKSYRGRRFSRMIFGVRDIYLLAKKENAEVYHFHDPELLLVAKRLKAMGKKVIFDCHEHYYLQIKEKHYLPKCVRKIVANAYRRYETNVLKKIDGVVFPVKMDGLDFESRAKRVAYVNNMLRLDEIPGEMNNVQERKGICYTGGLTYNRGILHLAKAANIAKVPLYLAGPFESDDFKMQVLNEDNGEFVYYKGILKREEVYGLYESCAIGMSTLLNVGQYACMRNLPTKVYEYMAMGMPVILSDTSYNRSVIERYKIGLVVDPQNPEDIAEKMMYLFEYPEEMRLMGEKGKKLVYSEWNWSSEEKKLVGLYNEIVNELT